MYPGCTKQYLWHLTEYIYSLYFARACLLTISWNVHKVCLHSPRPGLTLLQEPSQFLPSLCGEYSQLVGHYTFVEIGVYFKFIRKGAPKAHMEIFLLLRFG